MKKIKIGILTFHDGFNYGAFLQVFAMQQVLSSLDYDTHIINYKSVKHQIEELKGLFLIKNPLKWGIVFKNVIKMNCFKKAHKLLNLTEYTSNVKKISAMSFDYIIIGSDEVWNFEIPMFGFDPVYFGENLNNSKLISYAPSFGRIEKNNRIPQKIITLLNTFTKISVRDLNSQEIIAKNLNIEVPIVLDPTFLISYKVNTSLCKRKKFICIYGVDFPVSYILEIKEIAKSQNLKVISFGYHNSWCDENIIGIGPFEWLSYLYSSEFVITNMFHGTVFSLILKKKFILFVSKYREYKLSQMMIEFNLKDHIPERYGQIEAILANQKFDHSGSIEKLKLKSISFLEDAINRLT